MHSVAKVYYFGVGGKSVTDSVTFPYFLAIRDVITSFSLTAKIYQRKYNYIAISHGESDSADLAVTAALNSNQTKSALHYLPSVDKHDVF